MKLIKVLLSSMFVLTAIIKSSEVDMCGFSGFRFEGIKVHFVIKDSDYNVVASDQEVCGKDMEEIRSTIKDMLHGAQVSINERTMEKVNKDKANRRAKSLVGMTVTGD